MRLIISRFTLNKTGCGLTFVSLVVPLNILIELLIEKLQQLLKCSHHPASWHDIPSGGVENDLGRWRSVEVVAKATETLTTAMSAEYAIKSKLGWRKKWVGKRICLEAAPSRWIVTSSAIKRTCKKCCKF